MGMATELLPTRTCNTRGGKGELSTIQELKQQLEYFEANNAHRNDLWCARPGLCIIVELGISTKYHTEKGTPSRKHTSVGIHMLTLHLKCYITEQSAIRKKAKQIRGKRLDWGVLRSH